MNKTNTDKEVIIIGGGVMGATLGVFLTTLQPNWKIKIFETRGTAAEESSNEWNNAGTGHAALCELNYTTENEDGSINIDQAVDINQQFEISKQFWSYLVDQHNLEDPGSFIKSLPHISFVHRERNVDFLKRRYHALSTHPLFSDMTLSTDAETIKEWIPLMMEGRSPEQSIAATKVDGGTDVNFGELTRKMFAYLNTQPHVDIHYNHHIDDMKQLKNGRWEVKLRDTKEETLEYHSADYLFNLAGGGALNLLQKTGIAQRKGIGGFPISGKFLVCHNQDVINQHHAKVYGKEPEGVPPMTVPHLDKRHIGDEQTLLFGPFVGFSPKFLKQGSYADLFRTIKPYNLPTMLAAGGKNIPLMRYMVGQLVTSKKLHMEALRDFVPGAKSEDWEMETAGQRVQVIRDTANGRGSLQFGTELVVSDDGTMAALLGESPGASTSVSIMLDLLEKCFPDYEEKWARTLKEMVPFYNNTLDENIAILEETQALTASSLGLAVR